MRTKGSDLLVTALENEGVERIFGLPGEENLAVVESLRHSKIELVLTRHEQAASFMAATIATAGMFRSAPVADQVWLSASKASGAETNCEGTLTPKSLAKLTT